MSILTLTFVEQGPPHHDYTELLLPLVPEMDRDWLTRRLAERGDAQLSADN